MGLTEKRLIHHLETNVIPQRQAELQEIAGSAVLYEFDWSYFLSNSAALNGLESWGFAVIADTVRLICRDAIGKEAFRQSIQKIHVQQWNSSWPTGSVGGGILSLLWDWGGEERFSAEQLEAYINDQI
jgi:hypothetical protein